MPRVTNLQKLFRAIASRDWKAANEIADAICSEEAKKGHRRAAGELRGALRPNSINFNLDDNRSQALLFPGSTAMSRVDRKVDLEEVVLQSTQRKVLDDIILEWRHRDDLQKERIPIRRTLLFHGPPGCGKSLTASAIACELSLPLFVVRFDAIIGAFLGQTAVNLRGIFQFAENTPCVLLLDELDALGRRRGNPLDVGELDRVVISLMQELDHAQILGMVIATTNLPAQLDEALWRRFDCVVKFPKPTKPQLTSRAKSLAHDRGLRLTTQFRNSIKTIGSYAELERLLDDMARRRALESFKESNGQA